jgi:predicted glycosyltransferase
MLGNGITSVKSFVNNGEVTQKLNLRKHEEYIDILNLISYSAYFITERGSKIKLTK